MLTSVSVQSQTVALVEGYIVDKSGEPLGNHPVIIQGTKQVPKWTWWPWGPKSDKPVKIVGVTDSNGFLQVIDLPPGDYTVKIAAPGVEPEAVKQFTLEQSYGKFNFKAASETQTNSLNPYRRPDGTQSSPRFAPLPMR